MKPTKIAKVILVPLTFIALILLSANSVSAQCSGNVAVGSSTSNTDLISDCNVLLSIKDHFNAGLNWSISTAMEDWEGVNLSNGRVVGLRLKEKNLAGNIPPQFENLSALQKLILTLNPITGSIPPELGNLSNLQELDLSDNDNLIGTIPPELGNLSSLKKLFLHSNKLTGTIPPSLGKLQMLTVLSLSMRCLRPGHPSCGGLTGSIPPELGNLSSLESLYLGFNKLSGSLPPQLGNLSNLNLLFLDHNRDLSGEIPAEFENMTSLEELYIRHTSISGCIPAFLHHITVFKNDNVPYCSVSGVCGSSVDSCSAGSFSGVADNSSHSLWDCVGLHGGSDVSCSDEKTRTQQSPRRRNRGSGGGGGITIISTPQQSNVSNLSVNPLNTTTRQVANLNEGNASLNVSDLPVPEGSSDSVLQTEVNLDNEKETPQQESEIETQQEVNTNSNQIETQQETNSSSGLVMFTLIGLAAIIIAGTAVFMRTRKTKD